MRLTQPADDFQRGFGAFNIDERKDDQLDPGRKVISVGMEYNVSGDGLGRRGYVITSADGGRTFPRSGTLSPVPYTYGGGTAVFVRSGFDRTEGAWKLFSWGLGARPHEGCIKDQTPGMFAAARFQSDNSLATWAQLGTCDNLVVGGKDQQLVQLNSGSPERPVGSDQLLVSTPNGNLLFATDQPSNVIGVGSSSLTRVVESADGFRTIQPHYAPYQYTQPTNFEAMLFLPGLPQGPLASLFAMKSGYNGRTSQRIFESSNLSQWTAKDELLSNFADVTCYSGSNADCLRTVVRSTFVLRVNGKSNENFVKALYRDFLGRSPSALELSGYVSYLSPGPNAWSRERVVNGFLYSPEHLTRDALANFVEVFGPDRPVSTEALAPQAALIGATHDPLASLVSLLSTDEFLSNAVRAVYPPPAGATVNLAAYSPAQRNDAFLRLLYSRLGLPLTADALTHWTGRLNAGDSRALVATGVVRSYDYLMKRGGRIDGLYITCLSRSGSDSELGGYATLVINRVGELYDLALNFYLSAEYQARADILP